jgi:ADP-ribosyl-[dinitrogen reductase] hydrolase
MLPMPPTPPSAPKSIPPRPVPASYWVIPGRLLVGEYPGSRSRADAMERLRSFLAAGITCFIDLTQPEETASYEALLPFATPDGRRVEYLRQPILDHGVPEDRGTMERILVLMDGALAAGHVIYLHCRAGIGRSATVAGCWLATQRGDAEQALLELQGYWRQSAQSAHWPEIPETEAQVEYVRSWLGPAAAPKAGSGSGGAPDVGRRERLIGAWLGLAVGDALGAWRASGRLGKPAYSQPTALALCLADSLLEKGRCDARDQIERYTRWQREGLGSATGEPGQATPEVAKALGTYRWRGLPAAGSHDPKDRNAASLPRVIAAATYSAREPAAAIALAGECSRTTHQSPLVIDACRYFASLLLVAIQGHAVLQVLDRLPEPVPGCWRAKPLKRELVAMAKDTGERRAGPARRDTSGDVIEALFAARVAVRTAPDFEAAVRIAIESGSEPALDGALAGALYGALHGASAIPRVRLEQVVGLEQVQRMADRIATRDERPGA